MPLPSPLPAAPADADTRAPLALWQCYHAANDVKSENDLVTQYLPLVKTIVGRLAMTLPSHLEIEEMQSVGVIGLLHAIRNFDPNNGASFETFARFRIRGAVIDELRKTDWASRTVRDKARRIQSAMMDLEQRNSSAPTEVEIAAELQIPLEQYQRWLEEVRPVAFVCLDSAASHTEEDSRMLAEIVSDPCQDSPHDSLARRELIDLIAERIKTLPDMQRKVLALYYMEDLRLREIAEAYGLTESRICQVHAQAILSIRSFIEKIESGSNAIPIFRR